MHLNEKIPSFEGGPHQCLEKVHYYNARHHHNKWAAREVTRIDDAAKYFCMWCFLGERKKLVTETGTLRTGIKVRALLPRR